MTIYNKLVRDKIPAIITAAGETPFTHIAKDTEYEGALREKLQEEVDEFLADPSVGEAADILEVVHAFCKFKGLALDNLEEIRKLKATERGAFEERIILEKTEKKV